MALPPLVSIDEFETWASRPVSNTARAEAILSAASTLVRTRSGRMWVDAAGDRETDVSVTQLDAAATVVKTVTDRVYFNPDGNTQEAVANYSRSVAAWQSLGMALSEDEMAMLGTGSTGIPGLSSVRVVAPAAASGSRHFYWEPDEDPENQVVENDE